MTQPDDSSPSSLPPTWSDVEELWEAARNALAAGDWDVALELADRLSVLRHASAFEIRGRAQWGAGRSEEALATLAEGLARAPHLWRLWELLGVLQSEYGRHDEADSSFRNALRCPQVEQLSVGYHCALLRVRQGRLEDAYEMSEALVELGAESLGLGFPLLRARLLNGLGRHAEAVDVCNRALALGERRIGLDDGFLASLHVERGKAYWLGSADRDRALADLRLARDLHPAAESELGDLGDLLAEA